MEREIDKKDKREDVGIQEASINGGCREEVLFAGDFPRAINETIKLLFLLAVETILTEIQKRMSASETAPWEAQTSGIAVSLIIPI